MIVHVFAVIAFMVVSFAAQGLSHFVINKEHFASVGFLRPEPIMALGLAVMVIQGGILSFSLQTWKGEAAKIKDGLSVSLLFGAFLVSYIAFVEPAKYAVPSIADWITVELTVGSLQFVAYCVLLGWIHQRFGASREN